VDTIGAALQGRFHVIVDDKHGRKVTEAPTHRGARSRARVLEAHLHDRGAAGDRPLGDLDVIDDHMHVHAVLTLARPSMVSGDSA
jgi:hypothetical protein